FAVVRAFLERSWFVLEHLTAKAPTPVLVAALAKPDPASGVADLLSKLAGMSVRVDADPFLEAMARGAEVKLELLDEAGGAWSAAQVAHALRISRQAVDKRRARGRLLAVPSGAGDYLYPRCQFTEEGVVPHL